MGKHTPGPWIAERGMVTSAAPSLPNGRTYGYGCGNDFVADLNDGEYHEYADRSEEDANARLIAAAPDLYAACEQVLQASEDGGDMEDIDWGMIRAALARANGGGA